MKMSGDKILRLFLYVVLGLAVVECIPAESLTRSRRQNVNNYNTIQTNNNWLDIKYSAADLSDIPPGLQAFAGSLHNVDYNQELRDALSTTDASFRTALTNNDFGGLSQSNLQNIANAIAAAIDAQYAISIPEETLVLLLNNNEMQVQGATHLLKTAQISTTGRTVNQLAYSSYPFTEEAVMCAVLLASVGEQPTELNYVPFNPISQLSYESIDVIDEFITGASHVMLRSYELSTDRRAFTQILYQFGKLDVDWTKQMSRCRALITACFVNLGQSLDLWAENDDFDNLLENTAKMFVCISPDNLRLLKAESLLSVLSYYSGENFEWQHGHNLVKQIFYDTSSQQNILSSTIREMRNLNKFLTHDIIEFRNQRQTNFIEDVVLTQDSLSTIAQYSDDPLLLHYLFGRAIKTRNFVLPTRGSKVTDLEVQRMAPFVGVLSVPDVSQYQDRQIEESIGYFQQKATRAKPGVAVMLVYKYLRFRAMRNERIYLTKTDFQNINRLLPALDYEFMQNCSLQHLLDSMGVFQNVANRLETRNFPLTAAQQHVIADRAQSDSGRNAKLLEQLGPDLSMALSPAFLLEQLTDLDEFFSIRVDNGEVTEGVDFLQKDWTPFQRSVIFNMYRQQVRNLALTGRMLNGLGKMASGISATDILTSDFSEIIGITSAVMRNGGDMNKAWLLSVQIRKAFASIHGLKKFDEFHLGLLGTANLQALDGMVLRMFSVREMELMNLADCNQVISKIGDLADLYLTPPFKRQELACMYIARCRLVHLSGSMKFTPAYDKNNYMDQFFNRRREDEEEYYGHTYGRVVPNYCSLVTQRMVDDSDITQQDFDTLGNLVCDLQPHVIRSIDRDLLKENLWMFRDCLFDQTTGNAIYNQIQVDLDKEGVISSLGHSLCSVVPSNTFLSGNSRSGSIQFDERNEELYEYVQYAYDMYYKMEDKYGLTKRHLNYGLFAFRDISRSQQSKIQTCFRNVAEAAWNWYQQFRQGEGIDTTSSTDDRLIYTFNFNRNNYNGNDNNLNNDDDNNVIEYSDPNSIETNDNIMDDEFDFGDDEDSSNNFNRRRRQINNRISREQEITCSTIHVLNGGSMIFLLNQLELIEPQEIARCVDYWGYNFNTTREQRRLIKDRVESLFGGFQNILPEYLIQMKWLCREMNEDEIYNLRLEDRQMIYYISQWPWRRWQRQALYRNIRRTFNLNVNTMSIQDFKALGEFFCGMDSSDIASIPPELYYSMATFVGELVTCDYNQMRSLLAKARSTQAFGEIEHWEERHVIAIGSAISGMSSTHLEMLTPGKNRDGQNLVAAIPAHVIPMIPDSVIENLDVEFFQAMTPEQIVAITPRQWHEMDEEQADAAMQIWFGYDDWPYSFLDGFREAGSESLRVPVVILFVTLTLYRSLF
ncbi:uncharacterized protein LOC142349757 isoform X2 [Convolutriloba macropyga]|uniref:uncharacterized protein LOC142349757 isoform X2 n=1 Tax=Convolutriloba macropyga TaxID=536237 RepID=UPI003F525E45